MQKIHENLWQSTRYSSGMLNSYAYFLTRDGGNILFYNTGNDDDLQFMQSKGGVAYQLLSHRDEASGSLATIKQRFGSKLGCSALESKAIAKYATADFFVDEHTKNIAGLSVIATPGHTDGSVCFLYTAPCGLRYLFTGDTIFKWQGQWTNFVIESAGGSNFALKDSLLRLRDLRPDIVMSSGFVGEECLAEMHGDDWQQVIDQRLAALQVE